MSRKARGKALDVVDDWYDKAMARRRRKGQRTGTFESVRQSLAPVEDYYRTASDAEIWRDGLGDEVLGVVTGGLWQGLPSSVILDTPDQSDAGDTPDTEDAVREVIVVAPESSPALPWWTVAALAGLAAVVVLSQR